MPSGSFQRRLMLATSTLRDFADPFLRDAVLDRFEDHLVFLDDRNAVDAIVVGEGLIIG